MKYKNNYDMKYKKMPIPKKPNKYKTCRLKDIRGIFKKDKNEPKDIAALKNWLFFAPLEFLELNSTITTRLKLLAKEQRRKPLLLFLTFYCNMENLKKSFTEKEVKKIRTAVGIANLRIEMYPEDVKIFFGLPQDEWWHWYDLTLGNDCCGLPGAIWKR